MPKFIRESKYLNAENLPDADGTTLTIKSVARETVGQGNDAKDMWILYFNEVQKGLGLNNTNGQTITDLLGTAEMNDWIGKQITLFVDQNVMFGPKRCPAIRVRLQSKRKIDEGMNIDAWQQDVESAQSAAEVFALKRKLTYAPFSDEDIEMCKVIADQRMTELKKAPAA